MEVDHFDPTLPKSRRNRYANLMLSTRHCNNMKRQNWPTPRERREGYRLLDPTKEQDYGEHIFEDPDTHELVGVTRAGRYHIDMLDLNHETFVFERRKRAEYFLIKRRAPAMLAGTFSEIRDALNYFGELSDLFIPEIPPPPLAPD